MPDNPRKKKLDRKRQSQQKHEVAYRNRARGAKSPKRTAGRSRRTGNQSRASRGKRAQGSSNQTTRGQRSPSPARRQSGRPQTLRELLVEEMADIYNAEKQLVRALPKMVRAANSEQLKAAFEQHLEETTDQVRRVEQAFEALGEQPKSKKCEAMEGLIEEGEHLLEGPFHGPVQDAGLIAAAQKIEHYEIASYGTICTWAQLLAENSALRFLKQTMSEEEAADKRLTDIAMQINHEANTGSGESENEDQRGLLSRIFPS